MKFKLFACVLALAVATWGQDPAQSAPSQTKPQDTKAQCACCEKMAAANKDAHGCCHHMNGKDAKDAAACCMGKDAKSCCGDAKQCAKGDPASKNAGCCGDKACCGEGKACCGSAKEGDKTAMSCCTGKQCDMHPASPAMRD